MSRIPLLLAALFMAFLLIGCSESDLIADLLVIDITATIDGVDYVTLQGNTLTWNHVEHDMPSNVTVSTGYVSEIGGIPVPIMTEVPWDVTTPLTLNPSLPDGEYFVTLEAIEGRERLELTQLPFEGNNYTTILCFDDGDTGGSGQYHARLFIATD